MKEILGEKYRIKAKGFRVVIEELKQRISSNSEKRRCYRAGGNPYRQKKLFLCNQKSLYQELDGKERFTQAPLNAEHAKEFWIKLWDNPVPYKEDAEWLKEAELELENVNIQDKVEIAKENVTMQLWKIPNRRAPGLETILGFWVKS